jgi:hypothetical protein
MAGAWAAAQQAAAEAGRASAQAWRAQRERAKDLEHAKQAAMGWAQGEPDVPTPAAR